MTRAAAASVALFLAASSAAQDRLQTVALGDGVYAILQPSANRFNDSNSLLVVGAASALVVDSQIDPASAAAVIAVIKKLTDKPVRYVVATHWHGDHVQGNQAYREAFPGVEFVAHDTTAEDMRTRATAMRDEEVARLKASSPAEAERLSRLEFVFPTMTLDSTVTYHLGGREVRLLHFRGHTRGDVVVHLPAERILATGDLVDDLPYLGHGFPADYLKTLHALDALAWDVMVPGHGEIRRGRAHLHAIRDAFTAVYDEVTQAVRDGLTLEHTKARVNLARHKPALTYGDARAGRAFDSFMAAAIERMYEEARGR